VTDGSNEGLPGTRQLGLAVSVEITALIPTLPDMNPLIPFAASPYPDRAPKMQIWRSCMSAFVLALLVVTTSCSTLKTQVKKTAVIAEEMNGYTYDASLERVLEAAMIAFTDDWHDAAVELENVDDTSFTTNWHEVTLDLRTRTRFEVHGTETQSGCQLTIEKVQEWYDEPSGSWGDRERSRAYRRELDVVERVEPRRARRIQARMDSVDTENSTDS